MITEQDVAPYVVPVRKVARMMARNLNGKVSPDDLQQAAWVRLVTEWEKYDPAKSSRRAWVCRLAFGAMVDAIRAGECSPEVVHVPRLVYSKGTRIHTHTVKPDDKWYMEAHSNAETVPNYRDFVATATETCGRQLTLRERDALWLYYGQGQTMAKIGELMGVSETRVSQIIAVVMADASKHQSVKFDRVAVCDRKYTRNRPDSGGRATTLEASKPHEN